MYNSRGELWRSSFVFQRHYAKNSGLRPPVGRNSHFEKTPLTNKTNIHLALLRSTRLVVWRSPSSRSTIASSCHTVPPHIGVHSTTRLFRRRGHHIWNRSPPSQNASHVGTLDKTSRTWPCRFSFPKREMLPAQVFVFFAELLHFCQSKVTMVQAKWRKSTMYS